MHSPALSPFASPLSGPNEHPLFGGASSTLNDGLVSFWKLGEASSTRFDSVGSNDLTDNNSVGQAAGKIGNAAQFNAASSRYLSVVDNPSLTFTTGMSWSQWIYNDSLAIDRAFAAKWTYSTNGSWGFQTDNVDASEIMVFIANALADSGNNSGSTTDAGIIVGTWYHVVWVYDGSGATNADRLKIFVNADQKTMSFDGDIAAALQNSNADLNLGKFGGGLTRYYDGRQDATCLYNRPLTAGEVSELFNSGDGRQVPF